MHNNYHSNENNGKCASFNQLCIFYSNRSNYEMRKNCTYVNANQMHLHIVHEAKKCILNVYKQNKYIECK